MDKLFIFLLCFYFGSAKVKINELKVPQSIESGTVEDVILDCDYEANDEPGLVVKWFRNGDVDVIYQWIPNESPPQASGSIKANIDATYKISNDRNTMYRALHIINITPELSGNYSCKVGGLNSEDIQTKSMIIYDPLDGGLNMQVSDVESAITCEGSGIYPKPNMTLYITNENQTEIIFQEDDETLEVDQSGFYNVSSVLYFTPENLTGIIHYICELTIAGTDYKERVQDILNFENGDLETEIEEDLNLINSSNSTDHHNETQDYVWFETQIEDEFNNFYNDTNTTQVTLTTTTIATTTTTTTSTTTAKAVDIAKFDKPVVVKANRSTSIHMPNVLSTILLMLLATILRL